MPSDDKKLRIIHNQQSHSGNNPGGTPASPDDLLEGLFNSIAKIDQRNTPSTGSEREPSMYEEPEMDPSTTEKIEMLQRITRSIEEKHFNPVLPDDLSENGYKVDYVKALNRNQCLASTLTQGPMLVIAGAGSGKTRIIVFRVSYLLEKGVDPQSILLLTFTRKASSEMLTRVEKLLHDQSALKIPGGTFHSFANFVLRRYSNLLGISPNFTIIDSEDAADTIDLIKTELKLNKTFSKFPKKARLQEIISASRNRMLPIGEIIEKEYTGLESYVGEIELIAKGYAKYKQMFNIMDYDDLMEHLHHHLKSNTSFRNLLQDTYRYLLVDEFQDTNIVQKEICDLIAGKHQNIMVVGDDSQSIYAFRGANFENILRFPQTYPDCKIIKIEENYRSNQGILDFTNAIVDKAKLGYRKKLYTQNTTVWKPIVRQCYSQVEEAEFIVDNILELREKEIPLNSVAVLVRAMWHSNFIQTELLRRNIPYVVVGGLKFTERRHIKDLLAFLRVILNPSDAVAWHRILKLLPGIGNATASKIIKGIRVVNGVITFEEFSNYKFFEELKRLAEALKAAREESEPLTKRIEYLIAYYGPILETLEYDFAVRMNDIKVFSELAKKYDSLEKFISDFALDPPSNKFQDKGTPLIDEDEEKPLVISTVHSAKGLEWYTVFIPFALDGLFPSVRSMKNIETLEEERRLFYVACSRAKEQLFITMPSYVASYNAYFSYPSRFIHEMDKELYVV